MSFANDVKAIQHNKGSLLCVGIDPDPKKIGEVFVRENGLIDWCKSIVDATIEYTGIFKPNIAFFASQGREQVLVDLIDYIREQDAIVILDSKRGDIGNTADQYANESFGRYKANAVTLNPYMGRDTLDAYFNAFDAGLVLLCRTSNPGGADFQDLILQSGDRLYEHVARKAVGWDLEAGGGRIALVVGATVPAELARVREIVGDMPLLVPGIGAQGGDVKATVEAGQTTQGYGMIINSSRAIIYADDPGKAARETRDLINQFRLDWWDFAKPRWQMSSGGIHDWFYLHHSKGWCFFVREVSGFQNIIILITEFYSSCRAPLRFPHPTSYSWSCTPLSIFLLPHISPHTSTPVCLHIRGSCVGG